MVRLRHCYGQDESYNQATTIIAIMPMLKIELRPGQAISIGDTIVTLEAKSGQVARLAVEAPKAVQVQRVQQQTSVAQLAAQQGIVRKA